MAGRTFEGMVFPDASPLVVAAEDVTRVRMFDVPESLRVHAWEVLPRLTRYVWHTLGEFRYTGEDFTTAHACWDGREFLYGVDKGDDQSTGDADIPHTCDPAVSWGMRRTRLW